MFKQKLTGLVLAIFLLTNLIPFAFAAETWSYDSGTLIASAGTNLPSGYEPSGAVWHDGLNKLVIVGDDGDVSMMNADGSDVVTWTPGGDLEGVTVADHSSTLVYLGVEDPDSIREFDLATGTLTGNSWDLTPYMVSSASNYGLEGLTYADGYFYAILQETGAVYQFQLGSGGSVTLVNTISGYYAWGSGLAYDSATDIYYSIYDDYNLVITLDSYGNLTEYNLPGDTQEGIAVHDNYIFIAEDAGEVWRYELPATEEEEVPTLTVTYQVGENSINQSWTTVTFDEAFTNTPVVFAQIQTENGTHDVQVDLRNITTTSFQTRLEEDRGRAYGWLDGTHYYEDVSWFALDPTTYPSGYGVEINSLSYTQPTLSTVGSVTFSETFTSTPLLLALIQTDNGTQTTRIDIKSLTSTGFTFTAEEDMGNHDTRNGWDGIHWAETIAYIAVDPSLDLSPWNILSDTVSVTNSWTTICFTSDCSDVFVDAPAVFATIQSENESDTVQIDIENVSASGFQAQLEELDRAGWDMIHGAENVAWFAYGELLEVEEVVEPEPEPEPEVVYLSALVIETSSSGVPYVISILENAGHTVASMTADDVKAVGAISVEDYDLVVYPGGEDAAYDGMDTTLQDIFQDYVYAGGGFIGICGGSIAGSDVLNVVDYYPYEYEIDMLGIGAGVTANYDTSWLSYVGASITPNFEIENNHAILDGAYSVGDMLPIIYAGGPVFSVDSSVTVIATYTINLAGSSYSSSEQPAIVETSYGDGNVILFAPHPEFSSSTYFLLENAAEYVAE